MQQDQSPINDLVYRFPLSAEWTMEQSEPDADLLQRYPSLGPALIATRQRLGSPMRLLADVRINALQGTVTPAQALEQMQRAREAQAEATDQAAKEITEAISSDSPVEAPVTKDELEKMLKAALDEQSAVFAKELEQAIDKTNKEAEQRYEQRLAKEMAKATRTAWIQGIILGIVFLIAGIVVSPILTPMLGIKAGAH